MIELVVAATPSRSPFGTTETAKDASCAVRAALVRWKSYMTEAMAVPATAIPEAVLFCAAIIEPAAASSLLAEFADSCMTARIGLPNGAGSAGRTGLANRGRAPSSPAPSRPSVAEGRPGPAS